MTGHYTRSGREKLVSRKSDLQDLRAALSSNLAAARRLEPALLDLQMPV